MNDLRNLTPAEHASKILAHLKILFDHPDLKAHERSDMRTIYHFSESSLIGLHVSHQSAKRRIILEDA